MGVFKFDSSYFWCHLRYKLTQYLIWKVLLLVKTYLVGKSAKVLLHSKKLSWKHHVLYHIGAKGMWLSRRHCRKLAMFFISDKIQKSLIGTESVKVRSYLFTWQKTYIQLQPFIVSIPIDIEVHTILHFTALVNGKVEWWGQEHASTFDKFMRIRNAIRSGTRRAIYRP